MTTDLKRALALKQFLNEDFFIHNDKAYEGTLDESPSDDESLDDFIQNNYTEIEEIDENFDSNYLVLTDAEADDKWDEALDSYLEECVLCELPDWARHYFDEEAWKKDARMDGRGHSLATYDGHEHYETIEGEEFYIYRV